MTALAVQPASSASPQERRATLATKLAVERAIRDYRQRKLEEAEAKVAAIELELQQLDDERLDAALAVLRGGRVEVAHAG